MYNGGRAYMCHGTHVKVKGQPMGVIYLFLPHGFQGSNSSLHSMQQVPLLTETCPVSVYPVLRV